MQSTIYTEEVRFGGKCLSDITSVLENEYSYIIIGAGSAGCVLANRLSSDPSKLVLLVEAGGVDTNDLVHIPASCARLQRNTIGREDWMLTSVPQTKSYKAMKNRVSNQTRGKVLGGSSSINFMLFVRSTSEDAQRMAAHVGSSAWDWPVMEDYFKRIEHIDESIELTTHRGKGGPLHVQYARKYNDMADLYIEAAKSAGHPFNPDYNGKTQHGVSYAQYTHHKGRRWSSCSAFLLPALSRPNLHVLIHAHTTKITFDAEKQATGINIRLGKSLEELRSSQDKHLKLAPGGEVICSAGSLMTPQILQLSGIGRASDLQKHGIECISDLPVGYNLQDHFSVPVFFHTKKQTLSEADVTPANLALWQSEGAGPLTIPGSELFLFHDSGIVDRHDDVQHHVLFATLDKYFCDNWNYTDEIADRIISKCQVGSGIYQVMDLPTILHPKSRGTVALASADPITPPVISPHYLAHDDDARMCAVGCMEADHIATTMPIQPHLSPMVHEIFPDLTDEWKQRDPMGYWIEYSYRMGVSLYHPTGTASMGKPDDCATVVTADCCVKGVKNVRVVDASIFPDVPSANTNVPTMTLALRAADIILDKSFTF